MADSRDPTGIALGITVYFLDCFRREEAGSRGMPRFLQSKGDYTFSIGHIEGRNPLSANIDETLTLPEFSVEGGEGIDDGNDGCYAIIHLGGGSDGQANAASI